MVTTTKGTLPFRGYRTWYKVVGELNARSRVLPLLVLHGGPGVPHDYLEDLARLADEGRPVVFYDQIGCGRSDHPDDAALWTMATYVDELSAVRDALGLDRVHLFGHSWGGWLALEYALGRPSGLASLVLARPEKGLPMRKRSVSPSVLSADRRCAGCAVDRGGGGTAAILTQQLTKSVVFAGPWRPDSSRRRSCEPSLG